MRLNRTLVAILLCATTLTLTPAATAARTPQKGRAAKTQAPAPQTEITKEKIETIVLALEEASKKKEFTTILPYLAPDFRYRLEAGGQPPREANRAQYIEMVKLGASLTLDYTYLRKSLTIEVAADAQSATAQIEAFEMLRFPQGTVAGHSHGRTTFKIYKGKILISAMEGAVEYVQ